MKNYLKIAFQTDTILNSLKVSLVVGLLLNVLNQWQEITKFRISEISFLKIIFIFVVPYLVSTYTIVKTKLSFHIGEIASIDANLDCLHCGTNYSTVKKGDIIPVCKTCLERTDWSRES
jgi:hypothetical protein